jgi:NAD(P)-dependent dehydrogenase (short-subunit alcohol dehydrogenase family)
MSLHNAKIFIVGGSSGIGLATACLALAQGAQVIIASSSPNPSITW